MTNNRAETTLFMLMSVDGKITTGDNDKLDTDTDFRIITGVKEGFQQYYDIEKTTDLFSLNTGRVMKKIGINERKNQPKKTDVTFIIIDNKPHLNEKGVEYLAKWLKKLYLVTTNKHHPVFGFKNIYSNIETIFYNKQINLKDLLILLKSKYKIEKITIQSGGTLNSFWLRESLIDHLSIVVAPCLIGGEKTQSLIGGESIHDREGLKDIKCLKFKKCDILNHSYIHLQYDVIYNTT